VTPEATPARKWRHRLVLVLLFFLIVAAIISRRPDCVFNAQFWAEDGKLRFASNYNLGVLKALTIPEAGYFQTFPRLAAAVAMLVPFRYAPLVVSLLAIAVQTLPAFFLLTARFERLAPFRARLLMSLLLIAIPTSFEVHANVTGSMWFLSLTAFLIVMAAPPRDWGWRIFDVALVALSGMTGPFCVFLLPVAIVQAYFRHQRWTWLLVGILCATAGVQISEIFSGVATRTGAPLGATPELFVRIVGGRTIVTPLLGLDFLPNHPAIAFPLCAAALAGAGLLVVYAFLKAPLELRLLGVFGCCFLAGALMLPLVSEHDAAWPQMVHPRVAVRYWVIPVVAFVWICVWMVARGRPVAVRAIGSLLLAAALWTDIRYWRYAPLEDLDFPRYAAEFDRAPAGQAVTIPINPRGWSMVLRKH